MLPNAPASRLRPARRVRTPDGATAHLPAIELRDAGIVDAVHAAPMMVGAIVAAIDRMRPAGAGRQSDSVGQA